MVVRKMEKMDWDMKNLLKLHVEDFEFKII